MWLIITIFIVIHFVLRHENCAASRSYCLIIYSKVFSSILIIEKEFPFKVLLSEVMKEKGTAYELTTRGSKLVIERVL
ncbi:hypothetical protein C1646_721905 [Rhizophagus diaphanus]|nr:hypothetical protein C1646_721905 [Rhizophagus diaphanus] [Rhizophagus sp. MUCL 43196]